MFPLGRYGNYGNPNCRRVRHTLSSQFHPSNFSSSYTVKSRKQLGRCIKFWIKFPRVILKLFENLLNRRVCFLHFSSSYIQVRAIIKVELSSRFYGSSKYKDIRDSSSLFYQPYFANHSIAVCANPTYIQIDGLGHILLQVYID